MAADAFREQALPLDEIPQPGTFRNRAQVSPAFRFHVHQQNFIYEVVECRRLVFFTSHSNLCKHSTKQLSP